ncbi:phospholipase D family protein [Burkholderia pseudomallei]|uniref:phospholipase D family protein n=1 Tax=Burkholderia pseudomallei TaxID=28450 RepID=UPI000F576FBB|nr:phospholipase D family protein [Burkholderia pseudomallei]MBM5580807.1 NgoFVII family restriction endonuclease [Burkholderia pseudomallei]MBM5588856.1 NgoFVII family restriction endonuclease [Burkholderia pseudomallei]RPA07142.1 NgoFVII family restriction endonuclease [Burkholderia pseudomallei]
MSEMEKAQLLVNNENADHQSVIVQRLATAKRFDCMVAFAKASGFRALRHELERALARGLKARFAVGLNFYLTEPTVLWQLFRMSGHNLQLYLSRSSATFHPKIYAISTGGAGMVVIGSANLTQGGLQDNHEASVLVEDQQGTLTRSVARHFDYLIEDEHLVPATKADIDDYEREFEINQVEQRMARRRAEQARQRAKVTKITGQAFDTQSLWNVLETMRQDTSERGFEKDRRRRGQNRKKAGVVIRGMVAAEPLSSRKFLMHYDRLLEHFHSGGLARGKTKIAEHAVAFQRALATVVQEDYRDVGRVYGLLLDHLRDVPGAGVNVITEILHALDNKRFAVMNRNAVCGMRLANMDEFPVRPLKSNVSPEHYVKFCKVANQIREQLGLANLSELDSVFNYAYWGHEELDG